MLQPLLILFCCCLTCITAGTVTCQDFTANSTNATIAANQTNPNTLAAILYQYCIADSDCTGRYFPTPSVPPNFTIFQFLVAPYLQNTYLEQPVATIVCNSVNGTSTEDINKQLWLLNLAIFLKLPTICGINRHPQIDYRNIRLECICDSDKICVDQTMGDILFSIILVLLVILAVGFVLMECWIMAKDGDHYRTLGIKLQKKPVMDSIPTSAL